MADSGGNGESAKTVKQQKRRFSSRLSSKLSPLNPFKRNQSGSGSGSGSASDNEEADPKKSSPSRREKIKSGLTSMIPRTPAQRKLSRESSDSHITVDQPQDSAASDAQRMTEASTPRPSGGLPAEPSATEESSDQQDSVTEEHATEASTQPATIVANPVATKPEAPKTGDAAVPKQPRKVVGGPVFGPPEMVLSGVKGDPDEVMKSIRARGFVIHLVRDTMFLCTFRLISRSCGLDTLAIMFVLGDGLPRLGLGLGQCSTVWNWISILVLKLV